MKRLKISTITYIILLMGLHCSCSTTSVFPDTPSREAHEGFSWRVVEGKELKMWAQSNGKIKVEINDTLHAAHLYTLRDSAWQQAKRVIQLFDLPTGKLDDLIPVLIPQPKKCRCTFKRISTTRVGVERYILVPAGKYLSEYEFKVAHEPIPVTCNGWGVGNSGSRYFERFTSHKNKVLFVEIGQEMPLFDENSLLLK